MNKLLPAAVAAALLLAASQLAQADDTAYAIKIHRPVSGGDRFNISTELKTTLDRKLEIAGADTKKSAESSHALLEADMTIGAVDAKGRETAFHLVIKKCQASKNDEPLADVVPVGTEINVTYDDEKATFTPKNGQLTDAARDVLDKLFSPAHSDMTEDDMFGADGKKKIGESWPVDNKAIARDAKGQSLGIDSDKISGNSKLVAAGKLADLPAILIDTKVEISTLTVPDLGAAKDAKVKIDIESQVPTAPDNPSAKSTVKDNVHAVFDINSNGQKAVMTIDSTSTQTETRILTK